VEGIVETAYYLIIERDVGGRRLRLLDDYATADRLIGDAADYEAGEFSGDWVGGLQLVFDASGRLAAASKIEDLGSLVRTELTARTDWKRSQARRERLAAS
jgi:hypothetical protein